MTDRLTRAHLVVNPSALSIFGHSLAKNTHHTLKFIIFAKSCSSFQ